MSFKRLVSKVEIPPEEGQTAIERQLASEDLLPVPPEKREWTWLSYTSFWIADSFNVNTFAIASSGVAAGLSWWQALIATVIGYTVAAPFLIANGRQGAVFHLKFPVVARASFGIFGSYWIVLNRVVMSCVWWGVQAWIGGECMEVMLTAIFPSYANIKNTFSASVGTTTKSWLGFFLFWLISLPTLWFPIEKARHFFTAKAIIAPIAGLTFMVWSLVRAHGAGSVIHEKAALSGSALAWPFLNALFSNVANMATLIVNNPDIASYADKPSAALLPQLITLPLGFTITGFVGILIASASKEIYGEIIWDPIQNLGAILDNHPSHAERFGVWFISASFIYVQVIMNLAANSIGFGCDCTALFPRFINIRRGMYICACVGLAYCPWRLFASSNAFTTYLSAYSVLLSSVAGVMLCDYYLVRKGNYRITDLYTNSKKGWYWYSKGWNWRAYAAYLLGLVPNMPGFVGAIGKNVPIGAQRVYTFSWFTGIAVSSVIYYVLNRISPAPGAFPGRFQEIDLSEYEEYGFINSPKFLDTPESEVPPYGPMDEDEEKAVYKSKNDRDYARMNVVELDA